MWSVENGVVICSSSKDYELQSWNEQGEITKIEGMLTVAFSFILSCSHIDSRKQLYLIMKIPYLVDMSTNKYVDAKNDVKIVKHPEPLLTSELYHQQNEKIKELSLKIDKLESEIEKLKKENLRLKIVSGEAKSGWQKDRDLIYRNNPDTSYPEQYRCPIYFKHSNTRKIRYYLEEDGAKWVEFFHSSSFDYDRGTYRMPHSAYLWLRGELPEQKKEKPKEKIAIKINDIDEMKNRIEEYNFHHYNFDYFEIATEILLKHKGKTFETKWFRGKCEIKSPTTVSKLLNMFETCKVIKNHRKGYWEVIIK